MLLKRVYTRCLNSDINIKGYKKSVRGYKRSVRGYKKSVRGYKKSVRGYKKSVRGYKTVSYPAYERVFGVYMMLVY
jgi:hypothetical protein